jgi:hypothetical protein
MIASLDPEPAAAVLVGEGLAPVVAVLVPGVRLQRRTRTPPMCGQLEPADRASLWARMW